jgi:hypothetical protein
MKGSEYFVSLQTSVVITEECNVMVNSEELIGTTEYLTLEARCRINRHSVVPINSSVLTITIYRTVITELFYNDT